MSQVEQEGIPLMSYLKIFFRRKETIIIATVLGLVLGVCVSLLLPKVYESSSVILVEEGKSDNPLFEKLAVSTTVRERLDTIRESMLGYPSLVKLVKRLKMDKDVKTMKEFEQLIIGIRQNINIGMRASNILDITYEGPDPVQTKAVVENITDIFIERNQEIQDQQTEDAIAFIEEQLKVYKGKIKSAEIAKMQDQLDELLIDSTEQHPLVVQLTEKITKAKQELAKENLPFTKSEVIKTESSKPLIETIKSALDNIDVKGAVAPEPNRNDPESNYYKFMLLEKLDNVMARDAAVNENLYNLLLQRLETAKITRRLQASSEGTKYTIIEPPRIPLEPTKPNRVLITLTGLILGAMVGFGLVFANEFLDKSFLDVEDAKEFLGAPLLGAISKINTEESIREERDRKRWLYSLTVVVSIMLVVVTVTISSFIR